MSGRKIIAGVVLSSVCLGFVGATMAVAGVVQGLAIWVFAIAVAGALAWAMGTLMDR